MTQHEDDIISERQDLLEVFDTEGQAIDSDVRNTLRVRLNEVLHNIHAFHPDSLATRYFKRLGDKEAFNFLILNLDVLGSATRISSKLHMTDRQLEVLKSVQDDLKKDRLAAWAGHTTIALTLATAASPTAGLAYVAKFPAWKAIKKILIYTGFFMATETEKDILNFTDKAVSILDPLLRQPAQEIVTTNGVSSNGRHTDNDRHANGHVALANRNGHTNAHTRSK